MPDVIRGFIEDGVVKKYDYESLENKTIYENPTSAKYGSDYEDDIITLATYNVLSANYWRWPSEPPCDTDTGLVKACRCINTANPDIIGLNEIPDSPKYTPMDKLKKCGYTGSFYFGTNQIGKQNALLGNGIMYKAGLDVVDTDGSEYESSGSDKRSYCNIVFGLSSGKKISVYETHLGLTAEERITQVAELKSIVASDTADYVVVMGDCNVEYGSSEYTSLFSDWLENTNDTIGTFIDNNAIIDYLFHTSNMVALDYGTVEDSDASDHRLLWGRFLLN